MKTRGGCFCGAVQYTAEVDENLVGLCHCRDCQIMSGSAFRFIALVQPDRFEITKGQPRSFDKTAESGNVRRMLFCGECGTQLASTSPDPEKAGAYVSLRVTTSDDFARFVPKGEVFYRSKLAWVPEIDGTARFDGEPPVPSES